MPVRRNDYAEGVPPASRRRQGFDNEVRGRALCPGFGARGDIFYRRGPEHRAVVDKAVWHSQQGRDGLAGAVETDFYIIVVELGGIGEPFAIPVEAVSLQVDMVKLFATCHSFQ